MLGLTGSAGPLVGAALPVSFRLCSPVRDIGPETCASFAAPYARGVSTSQTQKASPAQPFGESSAHSAFVTTQWSAVLTAGRSDTTRARSAPEQLCRNYRPPLYAYVRRRGYSPEDKTKEK